MQYKALYRKYRPSYFKDVVGQEEIVEILKNSINNNKVGHAYLFSGPRGTGKTSIAKIFAKTINCLESKDGEHCGKCTCCIKDNDIDVIEIDAASNNGVDEIREIRNNSKLLPSENKYKIYIIDEVHMLSMGAFNALLKTLEEPPEHIIFILATTEIQKIPLTILSRCQKFQFKRLTNKDISKKLNQIIKEEKINIENDAIEYICELSDGGLRDAINYLDQASSLINEKITNKHIANVTGTVDTEETAEFISFIKNNNLKDSLDFINKINEEGKNISFFCQKIISCLRKEILNSINENKSYKKEIEILKKFIDLQNALKTGTNQKILFEITLFELLNNENEPVVVKKQEEDKEIPVEKVEIKQKNKTNEINQVPTTAEYTEENINKELNKIKINNTLVSATKQDLIEIKDKFINIKSNTKEEEKFLDLLNECNIVTSSKDHIIFETEEYTVKNSLLNKIKKIEEFLGKSLETTYSVAVVTADEWENIKTEFKNNKKNNIKYEYIDENIKISENKKKKISKLENQANDIFGEDLIKIG